MKRLDPINPSGQMPGPDAPRHPLVVFRINLARTVVRSAAQRRRLYNGMLMYLAGGAALLVWVFYAASFNIVAALRADWQRRNLIKTHAVASEFNRTFFKEPAVAYETLRGDGAHLVALRDALAQRRHFIPAMNALFSNFPVDVMLENLEATSAEGTMKFVLSGPAESIKAQHARWRTDSELALLVDAVRQVRSEQRQDDGRIVYAMEFECVLK